MAAMMRNIALAIAFAVAAHAAVKIEKTAYGGWPNCYRMTNGEVELIATTDVGPRVIRFGYVGGQNLFVEFKDQLGKSGEKPGCRAAGTGCGLRPKISSSPMRSTTRP
jgi:hypothetical protein